MKNKEELKSLNSEELEQVSGGSTQFNCPLADQPYRCATHCRKNPCGNKLQGLMGKAWYCPITNEQMSD